jgi:D-threo-aldose 1-dehydrogenase
MTHPPVAGPRARELRTLGHSSVQVSRLSLGTAPLGGMYTSVADDVASELVGGALDAGLRYIDTAPHYGRGVSEERLGAVLPSRDRSTFVLSTKVGRLIVPADGPADTSEFLDARATKAVFDFSAEGVRRSIGDSLERLGLDHVDIVYIHDPDDYADQAIGEAYPVLHELREQGVVGAIGLGMNQSAVPARFVRETDIDAVLLAGRYTLIDQTGQADLLPLAGERGVSIVIGGVYNSGILADPNPDAKFDYAAAPEHLIERAIAIKEVCGRHDVTLPAAAIQFPLAHPAVATVLTGSRSLEELAVNLEAFEVDIPTDLWTDLAETGLLVESEAALRTM